MRIPLALLLGATIALGGCATRVSRMQPGVSRTAVASRTLPAPQVIRRRAVATTVPSVVPVRRTIPSPTTRTFAPRPAVRELSDAVRPTAVTAPVGSPPTPPSMELLQGRRQAPVTRRSGVGPNRVVPVSRSARVQPAVAAPAIPSQPRASRAVAEAPARDLKALFAPKAAPRPQTAECAGGT
jgi:hypothetical protein